MKTKLICAILLAGTVACARAQQTNSPQFASVQQVAAIEVRLDLQEYLQRCEPRPATLQDVQWEDKSKTLVVDLCTDEYRLRNWPYTEEQAKKAAESDFGRGAIVRPYEAQQDITNQIAKLAFLLRPAAERRLGQTTPDFRFIVRFLKPPDMTLIGASDGKLENKTSSHSGGPGGSAADFQNSKVVQLPPGR